MRNPTLMTSIDSHDHNEKNLRRGTEQNERTWSRCLTSPYVITLYRELNFTFVHALAYYTRLGYYYYYVAIGIMSKCESLIVNSYLAEIPTSNSMRSLNTLAARIKVRGNNNT